MQPRAADELPLLIVGGGIGGLTLATALLALGFDPKRVLLFDKVAQLEAAGSGMSLIGHSISILTSLGVNLDRIACTQNDVSLRHAADFERVEMRVPLRGDGDLWRRFGSVQCNVHRGELQQELIRVYRDVLGGTLHQHHRLVAYETIAAASGAGGHGGAPHVRARFDNGAVFDGCALIGADGVRSAVRRCSGLPEASCLNYSGYCCWRGMLDLRGDGDTRSPAPHLRRNFMYKSISGATSSFTSGAVDGGARRFWAFDVPQAANAAVRDARQHCAAAMRAGGYDARYVDVIERTPAACILQTDVYDSNAYAASAEGGCVALVGDAAHALVHHFGQGACLAIEDAALIAMLIANEHGIDVHPRGRTKTSASSSSTIDAASVLITLRSDATRRALNAYGHSRAHHYRARLLVLISRACGWMYMNNDRYTLLCWLLWLSLRRPFVYLFIIVMHVLLFVMNRHLRDFYRKLEG